MITINDWMKKNFTPNPVVSDILAKAKKKDYNKKEEKKFDAGINAAAALAITGAENAAKAGGIDISKNKNNFVGISTIASLAKSGAELAAKAAQDATKATTSTPQKPKDATKKSANTPTTNTWQKPKEFTKTDAEKMVDYAYADENLPKMQSFLESNGFPSREDREYNKEFYGEQEEKKQTIDNFRRRTNSVLNPTLPDKTDRLFLSGLMGDEREEAEYQKQVADNKKAKSDYALAFRGSPFEHFFAEPQNPPAGMPLKKQDPVAELMAKYAQYQKNKPTAEIRYELHPAPQSTNNTSSDKREPTMWFENGEYAANQRKDNSEIKWELHPAPQSMNKTQNDSQKPVMHFENGDYAAAQSKNRWELHTAPKNLHISSSDSNKTQDSVSDVVGDSFDTAGKTMESFADWIDSKQGKEFLVGPGTPLAGTNHMISNASPVYRRLGQYAGILGDVLSFADAGRLAYEDYIEDGKINEKETVSETASSIGSWLLSSGGAALGSALVTALGISNPATALIAALVLGYLGDVAGDKLGEHIVEEAYKTSDSEDEEYGTVLTPPRNYKNPLGVM